MQQNERFAKGKEKPCYFYIDQEPLTSYREVIKKISSKTLPEKEEGLKRILGSMVNDDNYPQDLMISAIHHLTIVDDINVKKLLFLFWEVIEKQNPDGKIKEEFILVCNSLRKDLEHPNEYIRGRTLRLLTKMPLPEILENLKAAVFENLTHSHAYVRSNALMCIMAFINHYGEQCIPDSMPDKLKDIILKDSDTASRRNAYLVYAKISPLNSLQLTEEIMLNNEISELGDLFALAMAENLKNLCLTLTQQKSKFIKLLLELSSHKSHSVLFEIGSILLQVSSNPNVIASAVNILCSLLHDETDNNTLIIILKKLIEIKDRHREILKEQILSLANILRLNYSIELRRIVFELINELISQSNITQTFDNFISTFKQLNAINENEAIIDFKGMILKCMILNIKKYPNINITYALFILDKNISISSKNTNLLSEQTRAIKDLLNLYATNEEVKTELLKKIINSFEEIDSHEIMQSCLWILSYYSNDASTIKSVFDLIMKNLGDLDFEFTESKYLNEEAKDANDNSQQSKKTITKTVVLPDGTYGTVTTVVDLKQINKNKEMKYLRKFILETNFYFSANLIPVLTLLVFKMKTQDEEIYKTYFYNTINIICSILKMNSEKIYKDPDNVKSIQTCLQFLINDDVSIFNEWLQVSKEYEDLLSLNDGKNQEKKVHKAQPDDNIQFRHCKVYDPDSYDVIEDHHVNDANTTDESNQSDDNRKIKFIEVLSGSEDVLYVEAVVEIFTFDLSIEFIIKNKSNKALQNVTIQLFVPTEFDIIEKAPMFNLNPGETEKVRSCVKFSKTINAYIFGEISFGNFKGQLSYLNLSGIFIELLNTYAAEITDSSFRTKWLDYHWEHSVMIVSKKHSFKDIISHLCQKLKMTLVFPKDLDSIDDNDPFFVGNLYTRTKFNEDALINISIEKTKDKRIIGNCIIRAQANEFMTALGEKIKASIN